ncbi:E3 ubiquitin ligase TRAF3IP2 [Polypterus senegalus]|nr:E3 ubiquitin ligase TRAF3IP2 [Polypterus senegalus]
MLHWNPGESLPKELTGHDISSTSNFPEENDETVNTNSEQFLSSPPIVKNRTGKMAGSLNPFSQLSVESSSSYRPNAPYPSPMWACPSCPERYAGEWPSSSSRGRGAGIAYADSLYSLSPSVSFEGYLRSHHHGTSNSATFSSLNSCYLEPPQSLHSMPQNVFTNPPTPYLHRPGQPACCASSNSPVTPSEKLFTWQDCNFPRMPDPACYKPGAGSTQRTQIPTHDPQRNGKQLVMPISLEQRKVFVTYETDNDDHVHEIIRFVTLLRQNGFDAHIDMFEQNFRSISKIDFMEKFISEKDFLIIIVISPKYYETVKPYRHEGMKNDESALNTVYIYKQLQNEYIQNGSRNFRFVPIIFPGAEKCHVPYWLQNTNVYRWPQDMQDILRRLMRVEKYNPPPIGELPTIVSIPI